MAFEGLSIEVSAMKAGFSIIKPPILKGETDIEHRFSVLASDGLHFFAFDIYPLVTEIEVMRSYAKKFDTGASTQIVYSGNVPTEGARRLAAEYNMQILSPEKLSSFFELNAVTRLER